MHIKFVPFSLLYGESVFWLLTSTFTPFYWFPDLSQTKHRTAVLDNPYSKQILWLNRQLSGTWFVRSFWPALISTSQVLYLVIFVVLGLAFQTRFLELFGIHKTEDSLTYLALFYCPTVLRLCVLITTLSSLARIKTYNSWTNYDKAEIFAVDERFQKRVMLLCALSIVPDCFFGAVETFTIIELAFTSSSWAEHFHSTANPSSMSFTTVILYLTLMGLSFVNVIMRHKPLVDVMYLCACIRKHFQCINSQIVSIEATVETNRMFYAPSYIEGNFESAYSAGDLLMRPALVLGDPMLKAAGQPQLMSNLVELTKEMRFDSSANNTASETYLIEDTSHCVFTNLKQLERHLTQVNLFIKKADNESPTSVFGLALADVLAFFYSILYRVRRGSSGLLSWATLINLAGIGVPTISLFVLGYALERECRALLNKLEVMYLEKLSHSLLYKQKSDTQLILGRVFDLLGTMKFDFNGLMEINLFTLVKSVFYVCGAIFVILQYDIIATSP